MAVLERSELKASPLADLHAIADQLGLDGFRRLRKADLIDTILGEPARDAESASDEESEAEEPPLVPANGALRGSPWTGRRGATRTRRQRSLPPRPRLTTLPMRVPTARSVRHGRVRAAGADGADGNQARVSPAAASPADARPARRAPRAAVVPARRRRASGRTAEGIVEVLGNGSAFLRVDPPEPSDDDVYISAAQVRRCELVSGDRVSGPVRTPRRSERYPSLVRIDTINGTSADSVSDGARYEDLPVAWPAERLALGAKDPTLEAIEWLTPLGKGSRVTIVARTWAGKSETLHRLFSALRGPRAWRSASCWPGRARRRSPTGRVVPWRPWRRSASRPRRTRSPRRSSGRSTRPSGRLARCRCPGADRWARRDPGRGGPPCARRARATCETPAR